MELGQARIDVTCSENLLKFRNDIKDRSEYEFDTINSKLNYIKGRLKQLEDAVSVRFFGLSL